MENAISKRPAWFIAVAIILLLWAVAGVASFGAYVFVGEKMAAEQGAGTAPYSYMASWAQDASGGYIWTDYTDDRIERYQTAAGVQSVLYTSSDGGSFTVMVRVMH